MTEENNSERTVNVNEFWYNTLIGLFVLSLLIIAGSLVFFVYIINDGKLTPEVTQTVDVDPQINVTVPYELTLSPKTENDFENNFNIALNVTVNIERLYANITK